MNKIFLKSKFNFKTKTSEKIFNFKNVRKCFTEAIKTEVNINNANTTAPQYDTEMVNKYKSLVDSFNKDWKKVSEDKELYRLQKIKEELLPSQRQFIELLANKLSHLNYYQINYVMKTFTERINKIKPIAPVTISEEWYKLQQKLKGELPQEGTKFAEYEEIMKNVSKWYQSQIPGFGIAGAAQLEKKEEVKVEKKEEKKEKEIYDVELTSFDPTKKIVLIKEVRALLNLGLKESKDLVEKAPCLLMRGVKKSDTEAILKKFTDNGAVMTLK